MEMVDNLTSIKKTTNIQANNFLMSPSSRNLLEDQMQELQLLNQQELIQKLKIKKKELIKQSEKIMQNCHHYFMDLTSVLMETENKIKKNIDKQTLNFLEQIEKRIDHIKQNQQSYNFTNQTYQTFKILSKNYTEIQQSIEEVTKILQKCYRVSLQSLTEQNSDVGMSTNKIYLENCELITTHKKTHGNTFQVTERQFQLTLAKFQEREQKHMLLNQRLKNRIKSLEETLSKKGLNIKELNKTNTVQNQRCSKDFWDLELERVKGENIILKQQINNISQKLISLSGESEALKMQYKKMIQLNISQASNPNQTNYQSGEGFFCEDNSRVIHILDSYNSMQSQSLTQNKEPKEENQNPTTIFVNSNLHNTIQNQMLLEYQKKNGDLTLQLTKRLKELEELRLSLESYEEQNRILNQRIQEKENELQKLSHHCATLQHDYEISSKKRFELQQKISTLKQSLKQNQQKEHSLHLQSQLRLQNLETILKLKEQNIQNLTEQVKNQTKAQYEKKIEQVGKTNQILQTEINACRNLIAEIKNQSEIKIEKLKEEFKKVQKTINQKDEELANLRQEIYQANKLNLQKEEDKKEQNAQTFKQKYENYKKEANKSKKELKQKAKQLQNLKIQSTKMTELLEIKCSQMSNRMELIVKEIQKNKNLYESKMRVWEEKQKMMREKYQFNLTQMLFQAEGKKINSSQIIQKYIQTMSNFCLKNAELKKLKEQNRDLKSNKVMTTKSSRKQILRDPEESKRTLEHGIQQITQLQRGMFEDRLKLQKGIIEQKLSILEDENKIMRQKLSSKQNFIKEIQEETGKLKREIKKMEDSTKRDTNQQKLLSQKTQMQQRIEKLQSQLKSSKNLHKKAQQQLTQFQNQLKKKREHIINVKKQLSSYSDQVQELNFIIKSKNEDIQKLKRQLKDQSTKENLLNQMKDKMQEYDKLEQINQELKKQIQKLHTSYKFEVSKLQSQIKELKSEKRDELNQKVSSKTVQLNEQLTDLKSKSKKLKTQLERKQSLLQTLKTKHQSEIKDFQTEVQQAFKQISRKNKQIESTEKKIQILNLNQRKFKQRAKLLTVIVEKLYSKILKVKRNVPDNLQKSNLNKENTVYLLQNTSPITRVFSSNIFNSTVSPQIVNQKDNPTLQTLAQLDINLEDLQKYSEGLQMFGVNAFQLKSLQTGPYHNQASTISHFMNSPECIREKKTNTNNLLKSPNRDFDEYSSIDSKQKISKLSECLSQRKQVDVGQILSLFDQILGAS